MEKPRQRSAGGAFLCMFAAETLISTLIMGFFDFILGKKSDKPNFGGLGLDANTETVLYFQAGVDKYVAGNYKEAVVAFSSAIQKMPSNANFYTFRGTAYEDSGDDISAQKDFEQACSLDPTSFLSAYRLGMVYARKKDFDNAITWLYKAYNAAPDVTEMHHMGFGTNSIFFVGKQIIAGNLGNMLFQGKSPNEALRILERAIELEPQYPNPYMTKGLVLARLGNKPLAKVFLEKAYNMGMKQAKSTIDMLAREEFIDNSNNELKSKFRPDIVKNVKALLAFKGEGRVGVQDLEQEAIYYACDILLHQKSQAGRFPSDEIMTDIIKCTTNIMRELFPNDYTEKHAAFAQEGVRINLTQAPDMQQFIDRYYAKIYQRGDGFTSQSFVLNGLKITVKVPNVDDEGKFVKIEIFPKTTILQNEAKVTDGQTSEAVDFFTDVKRLVAFMNKAPEQSAQVFYDAVDHICVEHVKMHSRLIDIDLMAYIYSAMHIFDAYNVAICGEHFNFTKGQALLEKLKGDLYVGFREYIWVNKRSINPFATPRYKSEVVKLTEINSRTFGIDSFLLGDDSEV